MENNGLIQDTGLFVGQKLFEFSLSESFESITNLFQTIKEYREYSNPDEAAWFDYIHQIFYLFGFNTVKVAQRLITLQEMGSNQTPKALVCIIGPKEDFQQIVFGLDWESYLFYAAKYHQVEWVILTNGLQFKVLNYGNDANKQKYFKCELDEIIKKGKTDSFFTLYKIFTILKGQKKETIKNEPEKKESPEKPTVTKGSSNTTLYDLVYHIQDKPNSVVKLYETIKAGIFTISDSIEERFNKKYIGYFNGKNFCEIHFLSDHLKVWVNANIEELDDPYSICRDVRKIGHYGTGNTELYIYSPADIDKVFSIIEQSYRLRAGKETPVQKREPGERHINREEFWSQLLEKAKIRTPLHRNIKPGPENWISASSGIRGVSYNYVVRMVDAQVEIYIDRGDYDWNKRAYSVLLEHKEEIEKAFGDELDWQKLDDKRACRIRYLLTDCGLRNTSHWHELHNQLIVAMIRLADAFQPIINKLLK